MTDVAAFLAARLDDDQWQAEAMRHTTVDFDVDSEAYACPASRSEPVGDLPWGEAACTCGVEPRRRAALDRVAALKSVASLHRSGAVVDRREGPECAECSQQWPCQTIRALAGAFRAHSDYERACAASLRTIDA